MASEIDLDFLPENQGPLQHHAVVLARLARKVCLVVGGAMTIDRNSILQLYRCLSSVGANVREAKYAESTADFRHKLKLAEKELSEGYYWLGILQQPPSVFSKVSVEELASEMNINRALLRRILLSLKSKKH